MHLNLMELDDEERKCCQKLATNVTSEMFIFGTTV